MKFFKKHLLAILLGYIFIATFRPNTITHLTQPNRSSPDAYFQYFILNNNFRHITHFRFSTLFNTRMFYPEKNTLSYSNSQLIETIPGIPFYIFTHNPITATNIAILLAYYFSFLSCYFVVYSFLKSRKASLLAAIVYAFNPFVLAHVNIEVVSLEWIPLIFLAAERLVTS